MQVLRIAVVTIGVLLGLGVLTSLFGVWESARLTRSFPAPVASSMLAATGFT